ncbi:damage-inducible protein [Bordetella genomosp. 8]|uniref:Damage-inducible protein n=1 Tax=Bordetella genomosp. 8 TaxID=1416806 RepID=A0A1W6YMM5_9BORD|nr:CinA family protein [Bordetella genomosp. 8]ARP82317.1 damage-inducible protein [Bordetella genomosp. 8]
MNELQASAASIASKLKQRGHTLGTVESSAGGLIAASLLAVPGASAYFIGGAIVYTAQSRHALLDLPLTLPDGMRSATEDYAAFLAEGLQRKLNTTWVLAETGASGPSGNRYGDAPGHACLAVRGPHGATLTVETGDTDRGRNMQVFAAEALRLLDQLLDKPGPLLG